MTVNRGKRFEKVIEEAFMKVPGVSIDRLHDQTTGFAGSTNICDYIVYKKPFEYYIECKSVHGNTLSIHGTDDKHRYGNITNKQWEGLLEKSKIKGVYAGIICWWIDKGVTKFIPIQALEFMHRNGYKSIRYDSGVPFGCEYYMIPIEGDRKRVFFDYDMDIFFYDIEKEVRRHGND